MFQLVSIFKAITEIILFCLAGQAILFIFTGESRLQNAVYRLFSFANAPAIKLARFLAPRFIIDRHIGLVAFFLFGLLWIVLVTAKIYLFVKLKQTSG
ncbi:MAG: hypothetical protein H0U63_04935 [Burkholderiales bacterium]|nr:hypothetical protein [Burkholderiales bacterium]